MSNIDIIYNLIDLSAERRKKILLTSETPEEILEIVSEKFKKPLFKILLEENQKHLLEEKLNKFSFGTFDKNKKYGIGNYLLLIEEAGEL
jgi:hypothetical protein